MNHDNISFRNSEEDSQFQVHTQGSQGMIEYEKLGEKHLDLYHTEVDPELEGKGVARVLVQRALEYCRQQNYQVTPTCTYVAAYIKRHPEFQDLVAQNR
ncbi:GNAT family N-acetyltransferase [Adhaeribacter soli]|uniref:N-acetyltransferase n=1 Tax=Adhaeribacter soli TaxID=2607655 RepID=A0A5N1IUP5_9BACT|nr:GNAT family N-acetyltransferase [Adhaeribacter soli]KAA9331770.1 N-acetyltransferase [Adhaeribacter soli]